MLCNSYDKKKFTVKITKKYKKGKKNYIKDGKTVMLVVGTAHFLGNDGIISLLEKQGFTVTQITSADQFDTHEIKKAA